MAIDLPIPLTADGAADRVALDGATLLAACESSPLAQVEACPGWTNTDLAIHTTNVHRRVAHWCSIRAQEPERGPKSKPEDDENPWDWCRAGLDLVVAALRDIGGDEPVWSWTDRRNGGFYHRRMVQETVVHRWDAETAAGANASIEPAIAADGIDEVIHVGMRFRGDGSLIAYPSGSVSIRTSDTDNGWHLAAADGTLTPTREASAADATVTGSAEAVLLWIWGRSGAVTIDGDREVAEAWSSVAP